VIERQIDACELRLSAFVDALSNGILIPAGDVSRFGEPAIMFANINAVADLDHLTVAPHLEHQ
jgi:hypothetical protein